MGNIIALFNGSSSNIPTGWVLCDGSNGTPDLRDKFIKGAVNFTDIGAQGGSKTHSHTLSSDGAHAHTTGSSGSHAHTLVSGDGEYQGIGSGVGFTYESHNHSTASATSHSHSVTSAVNVLPPYYTLCFIMAVEHSWDFPIGSIVMYTGTKEDLPEGWQLCNGENGTPDLRNRFIKGAATKGSTGGSATHSHTLQTDGAHNHTMQATSFSHGHRLTYGGTTFRSTRGSETRKEGPSHSHSVNTAGSHSHTVSQENNDPPYYKLAFIQKIS